MSFAFALSLTGLMAAPAMAAGAVQDSDGVAILKASWDVCFDSSYDTPAPGDPGWVRYVPSAEEPLGGLREYWAQGVEKQRGKLTVFELHKGRVTGLPAYALFSEVQGQGAVTRGCRLIFLGDGPLIDVDDMTQWRGSPPREDLTPMPPNETRWALASLPGDDGMYATVSHIAPADTKAPNMLPYRGTTISFVKTEIATP